MTDLNSAFELGRIGVTLQTIANTLTASQKDVFVRLPGLVAYWPFGIRAAGGGVVDHSGATIGLTQIGTCPTGYDGNSFAHLGDGTNYLTSAASVLGLTGTETFIDSSVRGLTLGGWFNIDTTPDGTAGLMSKWGDPPERGYALACLSTNQARMLISGTGGGVVFIDSPAFGTGQWKFIVGRFSPSTEVAIFLDGVKSTNSTAIPASAHVSTQTFAIGRMENDDDLIIHGKTRDLFVCAAALSDALIDEIRVTSLP